MDTEDMESTEIGIQNSGAERAAAAPDTADSAMPSIAGSRRDERGLFEPAGRVPERAG